MTIRRGKAILGIATVSVLVFGVAGAADASGRPRPADTSNMVVVHPTEIGDAFVDNPGMGWVLIDNALPDHIDVGSTGSYPDFGNVAVLSDWAELEPSPGVYDWSLVDEAIDYWSGLGKRIQFRIATEAHVIVGYDHPDPLVDTVYNRGTPEWLIDPLGSYAVDAEWKCHDAATVLPDCQDTSKPSNAPPNYPIRKYQVPNYEDPVYQERLESFLEAFGDKYNDNPYLETVDLMGYGEWGEWHSGHDFSSVAAREEYLGNVIKWWSDAFPDKVLGLSSSYEYRADVLPDLTNPSSYDEFKQWHGFDYAFTTPNVGFRRDGFTGCVKQYDSEVLREAWARDARELPLSAEFCGGYPASEETMRLRMDEALSYHPNYMTVMGWSGDEGARAFQDEATDIIDEGNLRLGYRLALNEATFSTNVAPGGTFELRQTWNNRAVGRLWQGQKLKVYLTDGSGATVWSAVDGAWDGKDILEGEATHKVSRFTIPSGLSTGTYTLRVALVGEDGEPAVKLSIAGNDGDPGFGRYPLGDVVIGSGTSNAAEDFEGGSFPASSYSGGTAGTTGAVTTSGADVISGTYSVAGSAPSSTDWADVLYSDKTKLHLAPSTSYTVTFKYKTPTAAASGGYHYFLARSDTAGLAGDMGFTQWTDTASSSTVTTKTVSFTTGQYNDYFLVWGLHKGGKLVIDDVTVKINDFEGFDQASTFNDTLFSGGTSGTTGSILSSGSNVIAGTKSATGSAATNVDWRDVLYSNNTRLKLRPLTSYTVTFTQKTVTAPGTGGFHYFLARTDTGGLAHDVGFTQWTEASASDPTKRSVTFTTDNYGDYFLVWGMHLGGQVVIDDISISANPDVASGQILHMDMEDASSQANAVGPEVGTLLNGAATGPGRRGQGIVLDGVDSRMDIGTSTALNTVQSGSYSVSASFYAETTPAGVDPEDANSAYGIIVKPGYHEGLTFDNDNRFHMIHVFSDGSSANATSLYRYEPGTWHTVTGVVNLDKGAAAGSKGTVTLYVDGVWQATTVFDETQATYAFGSAPWRVGEALAGGGDWSWPADGVVDDVRIWNRALTEAEAQFGKVDGAGNLAPQT